MDKNEINRQISSIPILDVAKALGIRLNGTKAMCFNGHDKKTPSLSFSKQKNIWKCFGCDIGGNGITLVMEYNKCDYKEALKWFERYFNLRLSNSHSSITSGRSTKRLKLKRMPIKPKITENTFIFRKEFSDIYTTIIHLCDRVGSSEVLRYLLEHGISQEIADKYQLREVGDPKYLLSELKKKWNVNDLFEAGIVWDLNDSTSNFIWKTGTIIFPFMEDGKIMYLQGRQFNKDPKFLNPRNIPKLIYNIDLLKTLKSGATVYICEGVPDTLAVIGLGLPAIGILGASSFKSEWVDYFVNLRPVILPDGDSGGEVFAISIIKMFTERGILIQRKRLPAGADIASFIKSRENND